MKEFLEILQTFDEAMLVTHRNSELRSRPMAIADCTDDGRVRFITRDDSGKLAELDENPKVNVALQGDQRYLSISGTARLTKEPAIIDKAWARKQNPWFREGRDDPHVMVLEVVPGCVEYWDRSGENFVSRILGEAGESFRNDANEDDDVGKHGRVDFKGTPVGEPVKQ
jgi:general stress protein 26